MYHKIKFLWCLILLVFYSFINETSAQSKIDVMTFNVRYDEALFHEGEPRPTHWANRKHLQVELIQKLQPDVIGMQEPHLHQIEYFESKLSGFEWIGVGRGDGIEKDEFNPIFYKSDKLKLLKWGTFWLSDTPEVPSKSWDAGYDRICTWALFQLKQTKEELYVFNTHFDSKGKEARLKSAELINKKITDTTGEKPVFVMGDFNFKPNSEPYNEITSKHLSDSKNLAKQIVSGPEGTMNGFRYGATFKNRIDFIFVNDKIMVDEYKVIDFSKNKIYPSDHFPVCIKARLFN